MSIYVTSDLHGTSPETLKEMLSQVNFCEKDFLYILGDVIDRNGDGGVALLSWLKRQNNIELLLGNHEAMLLSCQFVFDQITEENIDNFTMQNIMLLENYQKNGGDVTLKSLQNLLSNDPDELYLILKYLQNAPLFKTVSAGGKDFILVHSGLDNFEPEKHITQYTSDELLWAWPEEEDQYYSDIITVFGHTPTMSYNKDYKGKILQKETWIDVDVGVAYGNNLALLRLDDLKEFYIEDK